jgi:hypothetical protein
MKYLSKEDQHKINSIANDNAKLSDTGNSERFLEALLQLIKFKQLKNDLKLTKKQSKTFEKSLIQRSKMKTSGSSFPPVKISPNLAPDKGHDTSWISAAMRRRSDQSIYEFHIRPGVHDRMSRTVGFSPYSDLKFLQLEFDYKNNSRKKNKIDYKQLVLLNAENNLPVSNYETPLSWRVNISHRPPWLSIYDNNNVYHIMGEAGWSWKADDINFLYLFKFTGFSEISSQFKNHFRGGMGVHLGLLFRLNPKNNISSDIHLSNDFDNFNDINTPYSLSLKWAYMLNQNMEFMIDFEQIGGIDKKSSSVNVISIIVGSYF